MTEPGDTPTCGTGLAANAVLPAKLGDLLGATAEVLERHSAALDRTEPAGRAELEAYTALVRAHRAIARDLAGLAQQMAGYRDLPVARHDEAVLADPAGQAAAFSPDGKKVTFNEPRAVETMEWLVRARQSLGGRAAVAAFQQAAQGKDPFTEVRRQALGHYNYALYFSWPQTVPDLKWGTFPVMPQQKGATMALPHRTAWGWGMMSTAKEKDAAWLLVKKMTADEDGGGYLQVTQGRPSPIRKVNESGEFKRQNPYWQTVVKTVEQRWKRPASFIPPDASAALGAAITRIANEEVAPRSGLADAAPQVQAILDQYWAGKGR
jgi:ABC-type glycerol-3-phosphate transport system substrate-binding protein